MTQLFAVSDLHVEHPRTRAALDALPGQPDDWLIVAGDVADGLPRFAWALDVLCAKFARVVWVPGNHELWSVPGRDGPRGEARYEALVSLCRDRGVLTPEDPYEVAPTREPRRIVPLFLLYDYSFAPDGLDPAGARAWAMEHDIQCTDEWLLDPAPYPTIDAWCRARVQATEARLRAVDRDPPWIVVNHFPLRRDLVTIPRIPRFSPWCGTRATEQWHRAYPVEVAIHGHLHVRGTYQRDGVRFEEVSLGYPRDWDPTRGVAAYLRRIA